MFLALIVPRFRYTSLPRPDLNHGFLVPFLLVSYHKLKHMQSYRGAVGFCVLHIISARPSIVLRRMLLRYIRITSRPSVTLPIGLD